MLTRICRSIRLPPGIQPHTFNMHSTRLFARKSSKTRAMMHQQYKKQVTELWSDIHIKMSEDKTKEFEDDAGTIIRDSQEKSSIWDFKEDDQDLLEVASTYLTIYILGKKMWQLEIELSRFGKNTSLCRYDRLAPYDETIDTTFSHQIEIDAYNFHYNVWKNIFEFSVHPNAIKLQQSLKDSDMERDRFCCIMAWAIVYFIKNFGSIKTS